ncbi:hypothetical protein CPA40_08880 [Bifidobacterium callitrichos]|uniref:Uncharacterized protein n=1 Tax=Bifidobacterium callitrichos TaxID=762209 RepID=A0A2T3G8N7_9BIFI|nr:hypothetical protein CPA40_08880 [Bifidobacterium callitrichos]
MGTTQQHNNTTDSQAIAPALRHDVHDNADAPPAIAPLPHTHALIRDFTALDVPHKGIARTVVPRHLLIAVNS